MLEQVEAEQVAGGAERGRRLAAWSTTVVPVAALRSRRVDRSAGVDWGDDRAGVPLADAELEAAAAVAAEQVDADLADQACGSPRRSRTWSMTCCGVAVRRRLTTWVASPTNAWTRRSASAASSGWATVPVSRTMPFIGVAVMFASGIATDSIWPTEARFWPTRTLAE